MGAIPFLAGLALALTLAGFAALAGFDRERGFYPTLLMVIASYYALFAVMGAGWTVMGWETAGLLSFCAIAAVGFRRNLWIVVAALCCHGWFDAIHDRLIANPGTPEWWPAFCLGFDVTAGACLAVRIHRFPSKPSKADTIRRASAI